jgi:glycine/D-amino acid oxidase-like deaminating enzyme
VQIHIVGAGLHGASLAYYLTKMGHTDVNVVERVAVACAASGKGGGFLARDWGDGPTIPLHHESFQLHSELAQQLGIESYRKIPVLSVRPGKARTSASISKDLCSWLDGDVSSASVMDDNGGAQVDPHELATKLMDAAIDMGAKLIIGNLDDIVKESVNENLDRVVGISVNGEELSTDAVVITMGPWGKREIERPLHDYRKDTLILLLLTIPSHFACY